MAEKKTPQAKKPIKPRKKKKSKKSDVWKFPERANIDYQLSLITSLDDWFSRINTALDASVTPQDFDIQLSALQDYAATFGSDTVNQLPELFKEVATINDGYWLKMLMVGTGRALAPAEVNFAKGASVIASDTTGIDVFRSEPWLAQMQQSWVSDNVSLIRTIPQKHLGDMESLVGQAMEEGWRIETLASRIKDRYHIPENRAVLIATDQVGKSNSNISMQRMRDYGIRKYRWRGAMDGRERSEHVAREGEEFDIDHPPPDGPPGYPIRCRCWPEPVWDIAA